MNLKIHKTFIQNSIKTMTYLVILEFPSTASNTEQLILHEEQDDVYRGMLQKLNKEQKEFFHHVLHLLKSSDNPF